jgi:hypothetical protein
VQRHTRIWGRVLVAAIALTAYATLEDPDGGDTLSVDRPASPAPPGVFDLAPVQRAMPRTRQPVPELGIPSVHPMILYKSSPRMPDPDRLMLPIQEMERRLDLRR